MRATLSFVEYLITGTIAVAWVMLLFDFQAIFNLNQLREISGWFGVILIPFLYVLGMVLDFIFSFLFMLLSSTEKKRKIRKNKSKSANGEKVKKGLWPETLSYFGYRYPKKEAKDTKLYDSQNFRSRTSLINIFSAEIGRELAIRASRSKIARGFSINTLIFAIIILTGANQVDLRGEKHSLLIWSFAVFVIATLMWFRYEKLRKMYKYRATENILLYQQMTEQPKP